MRLLVISLCICTIFLGCDSSEKKAASGKYEPSFEVVHKALAAYNSHDINEFGTYFDKDVNLFKEHGLGQVRLASGVYDLKRYYRKIFASKANKIEVLNTMHVYPWIFLHQKVKTKGPTMEAVVGYRVLDGKIKDIMILGDKEFQSP